MKLTIRDLAFHLGEFTLDCSLDLESGELITLLGPSGCGKTSLLNCIAGLHVPGEGRIFLGDREITGIDPRFRKIAMVFQDYALFPHMNVEKNILYGMPRKGNNARKRCNELLSLVELDGLEKRSCEDLSGGEKQRVALARALASEPELLLLDEPLSALDARLRRLLRRQIREIQKKTGITTVYVTHDQEEAMAISDTVVLMNDGRVIQKGSPEELYYQPSSLFAGEFFGLANLIPLDRAKSEIKGFIDAFPESVEYQEQGKKMYLFFRPEACRLNSPWQEKDEFRGGGKVVYREFGADFHYLELATPLGPIKVRVFGSSRIPGVLEVGESVHWSLPPEQCRIL